MGLQNEPDLGIFWSPYLVEWTSRCKVWVLIFNECKWTTDQRPKGKFFIYYDTQNACLNSLTAVCALAEITLVWLQQSRLLAIRFLTQEASFSLVLWCYRSESMSIICALKTDGWAASSFAVIWIKNVLVVCDLRVKIFNIYDGIFSTKVNLINLPNESKELEFVHCWPSNDKFTRMFH